MNDGVLLRSRAFRSGERVVEAWSRCTVPFQPTGWVRTFRDEMRVAVQSLPTEATGALCATYASDRDCGTDLENLLVYNIGPDRFRTLTRKQLILEKAGQVPEPPQCLCQPLHYYRYDAVRDQHEFRHWKEQQLLAAWSSVPIPALTTTTSASIIWRSMKCAHVDVSTNNPRRSANRKDSGA